MFSWLRLGRKKPAPFPSPAAPTSGTDFADIFGARAAAAPARQTAAVSLDTPPAPPAPAAAPAPLPREIVENLLETGQFDQAAALLEQLGGDDAQLEWVARANLQVAQHRRHHPTALDAARRLIALSPANPTGYVGGSFALRLMNRAEEAETLIQSAFAACGNDPSLWIEAAQIAEGRDQTDLALTRWAHVRTLLPGEPAGWQGTLRLAARCQLNDVTSAHEPAALAKFPEDSIILTLAARNAARQLRWAEAAAHWQTLVRLTPHDPSVALEAVLALMGPPAQRRQRVPALLPALTTLRETFPEYAPAATAHVTALRDCGRPEEAAALAQTLRTTFPNDARLALAAAGTAEDLARPAEAVTILQAARAGSPPDWQLEAAFIRALALYGRDAQAEQLCDAALIAFPGNILIVEQHVTLASRRGDFAEAVRRVEHWRAAYPQNRAIARLADRMHALQDGAPAPLPATGDKAALATLFGRFESLGATFYGCEFGLVQRQFGAEPISLLRWGNMRIEGLTKALRDRFAGLGDEAHTRIKAQAVAATDLEYFIMDDRYHYWAHTFIRADEAPMEKVYQQTLRRLRFLRDKLIEDLEQAEKIFVFKLEKYDGIDPLRPMFEALRAYGPATLLCMALADETHPPGSVEMMQPGFFLGRVGRFAGQATDLPAWQSACETVAKWHDADRKQAILF